MKRQRITYSRPPYDRARFICAAPRLLRCDNGGWLAVTALDVSPGIGVFAWQVDDARDKYNRARREWLVLLDQWEAERDAADDEPPKQNSGGSGPSQAPPSNEGAAAYHATASQVPRNLTAAPLISTVAFKHGNNDSTL